MLCYEGRRKAIKVRKERDKASRREYTGDLTNPVLYSFLPSHAILEDAELRTKLYGCSISDTMDYYFKSRSLPDLRLSDYDIKINLENEKRNVKFKRVIDELKWNNEDMDSDLDDAENLIDKRDPVQVYIKACQQFKIHPRNVVIDGLATTELNLQEMSINDVDLKAICLALRNHKKVKHLRFGNNQITARGCTYLHEILKDSYSVNELDLSKNPIKKSGLAKIVLLFNKAKTCVISKLDLSNCQLEDEDGSLLKQIVEGGEVLDELLLEGNGLNGKTCKAIGPALKDTPSLRILNLSWNKIHKNDIKPICNGLKINRSLKNLDLSMNGLGNQGALLMADVLAKNDVIQELNISNNRIDKDGAAIFASKLELNRTIKKLWFGNNHIETLGSLMLLKAVDHINSQVEYLNLENILVNDDFTDLYTQINQYLRSLTVVHGGVRGRLGRLHPGVPGFTIMDDVDLKVLDQKTLHAFFQRDPFKILGRMAKESGHDFATALKKWDEEEHGIVLYEIYVEDFPNAVAEAGITLDKTLDHILWNYLKKVSKNGSVNYLRFIQSLPKSDASTKKSTKKIQTKK